MNSTINVLTIPIVDGPKKQDTSLFLSIPAEGLRVTKTSWAFKGPFK